MSRFKVLTETELSKKWIRDIWNPNFKKVATIGANGSAKSTYNFRFLFSLCIHRPRTILITSGTFKQVTDLFNQKLYPLLSVIGFSKANYTLMEFTLINGVEIHFKTAENYKTAEGVEYDAWFADEFQQHSKEAIEMFHKRTRLSLENSIFRIVGLPDEPDSFQYRYLEQNGYVLNEISLYDHPSKEWIAFYEAELKQLYEGEQLKRYLYGQRVSMSGLGIFAVNNEIKGDYPYNPDVDLLFSWDFNVEYRAVTLWQKIGKDEKAREIVACVGSYQMKNATVGEDAKELAELFKMHKTYVILHGDASGENRTAAVTGSMWQTVQSEFYAVFKDKLRNKVPKSNPSVKNTIECVNWAIRAGLVKFDKVHANKCFMSLSACKADKHGEIDKAVDYTASGTRTHEADTARYAIWEFFRYIYPGNQNRYFLV